MPYYTMLRPGPAHCSKPVNPRLPKCTRSLYLLRPTCSSRLWCFQFPVRYAVAQRHSTHTGTFAHFGLSKSTEQSGLPTITHSTPYPPIYYPPYKRTPDAMGWPTSGCPSSTTSHWLGRSDDSIFDLRFNYNLQFWSLWKGHWWFYEASDSIARMRDNLAFHLHCVCRVVLRRSSIPSVYDSECDNKSAYAGISRTVAKSGSHY